MTRGNWLILVASGLALPFAVAAFLPDNVFSGNCDLAVLLVVASAILWGVWRGYLKPRQALPSVPLFGAILIVIHGQGVLMTMERYALAMILAAILTLMMDKSRRVRS
jgi:hypothetical protein